MTFEQKWVRYPVSYGRSHGPRMPDFTRRNYILLAPSGSSVILLGGSC